MRAKRLLLDVGLRDGQPPLQEQFVMDDTTPYLLWRGSRRCGKTVSGSARLARRRWNYPGTKAICLAPDYNKLRDGILETLLDLVNPDTIKEYDRSPPQRLEFINGSVCTFYTASDPNVTRSMETNDVWIDEGPYCPHQSYRIVLACMSATAPKGMVNSLWITGTPRGYDWTHTVFGETGKPPDFKVFHTTIYDNPHLPKRLIRDLEQEYGGTDFERQELYGEYTLFEGLVYPQFDAGNLWAGENPDFEIGVGGIDLGDIAPSVLVPLGVQNGRLFCPEEFYARRVSTSALMENMADMEQRFRIAAWFCEPSAEFFIRSSRAAGFDVRPVPVKDVESGIRIVQQSFRDDRILLNPERCPNGVRELRMYQRKSQNLGESFSDTLIKANDHFPDALRYAIVGYERTPVIPVKDRVYRPADALFAWDIPQPIRTIRREEKVGIGTW